MKTRFYLVIALLVLAAMANAQQLPGKSAAKIVSVKDTVYQGVKFPLYIGSKGGKYIIVTSKTTGKEYKRYFKRTN